MPTCRIHIHLFESRCRVQDGSGFLSRLEIFVDVTTSRIFWLTIIHKEAIISKEFLWQMKIDRSGKQIFRDPVSR